LDGFAGKSNCKIADPFDRGAGVEGKLTEWREGRQKERLVSVGRLLAGQRFIDNSSARSLFLNLS
jgi:hypothetical protein